jgi:hypothetical protein
MLFQNISKQRYQVEDSFASILVRDRLRMKVEGIHAREDRWQLKVGLAVATRVSHH